MYTATQVCQEAVTFKPPLPGTPLQPQIVERQALPSQQQASKKKQQEASRGAEAVVMEKKHSQLKAWR